MTQYHVSAQAAKTNGAGSEADPFLTIGQAAAIARAGDEVIVHAGTYRESVDPRFGGESATNRIVYRAAAGEPRPVITGSERIDTWQPEGDGMWKAVIPNTFFNGYNPYVETVFRRLDRISGPKGRGTPPGRCVSEWQILLRSRLAGQGAQPTALGYRP